MEEKLNGIVLGGVNYGENDRILSIFTLEKGTVSARIKGVKKAGAKLKFASEPFCFAEFIFHTTQDRRIVTGASLSDSFYPVRENVGTFFCASTVLEFIKRFLKVGVISPETFMLSLSTLKTLAYGDKNPKEVLTQFLLEGLSLAGYGLNLYGCFSCGKEDIIKPYFDYESGGFFCGDCFNGQGREINFATYQALRKIVDGKPVSEEETTYALRLVDYYLKFKTEETLAALQELLKF